MKWYDFFPPKLFTHSNSNHMQQWGIIWKTSCMFVGWVSTLNIWKQEFNENLTKFLVGYSKSGYKSV